MVEQPAPQPEPRQRTTKRKTPEPPARTHEIERQPVIGTSPAPPPQSTTPVVDAAPVVGAVAAPATPTTEPVSQPTAPPGGPISGPSYTVRAGDSLWSIAKRLSGPGASAGQIAREVNRLWRLNAQRIGTGDPEPASHGRHRAVRLRVTRAARCSRRARALSATPRRRRPAGRQAYRPLAAPRGAAAGLEPRARGGRHRAAAGAAAGREQTQPGRRGQPQGRGGQDHQRLRDREPAGGPAAPAGRGG